MTEYDFSPAAYERHFEKQREIARWIEDTVRYTPTNPFVPSVHHGRSSHNPKGSAGADKFHNSPRNPNSDTDTDKTPLDYHYHRGDQQRRRGHRDRRHHRHHSSHHLHAEHGHGSPGEGHHRSSSLPSSTPDPNVMSPHDRHAYATGYGQPYPHNTPILSPQPNPYSQGSSPNILLNSSYFYPRPTAADPAYIQHPSPGQPLVYPIPGGTRGYVIVPPNGTSYQVVNQPQRQSSSSSQPWYKRVFSPTPGAKPSKTSSSGSRKQSGKWSWDIY